MSFQRFNVPVVVLVVLALASAAVQAQPAATGNDTAVGVDTVYGWTMMTEPERSEYQTTLQALKTPAEKQQFRVAHHAEMKARADARGVTLAPPSFMRQPEDAKGGAHQKGKGHKGKGQKGKGRTPPAFSDLDTDNDGFISRAEFAAHQASHRAMRRAKRRSE